MAIKAIKGMKDLLSPEVERWQRVEELAREHFKIYSYQEIRTPILEDTTLFVRGIGGDTGVVQKEMYTFKDKGDDSVTLRPEGTASVVRSYIEHSLSQTDPVNKLYYMGPMFRYERPQKGRLRQFHQIGAELIGPSSYTADVEVISLLDAFVRKLLITSFDLEINSLGCLECRRPFQELLKQFLKSVDDSLCDDCKKRVDKNPLRVFDCKNTLCIKKLETAPVLLDSLCSPCKEHFHSVKGGLETVGVPYTVNPRIARGLDYYQRTAFELISNQLGAQDAFAGGGRYDGLVKDLGGPDVCGVGFAIGLERLHLILPETGPSPTERKIYITFMGGQAFNKALSLTNELRQAGIICEMDFEEKSLKSQMRRANKLECSHVIILGEDEIKKNIAQVKDLTTQTQKEIPLNELIPQLISN